MIFLVLAHVVAGQTDSWLHGIAVEQNSRYLTGQLKYISGVNISSAGAVPQFSDAAGRFTLKYVDQPPGTTKRIAAGKYGYRVVNEADLQLVVIGQRDTVKVVMCKAEELNERRIAYYKLATDALESQYRQRKMNLRRDLKEREKIIAQLNRDRERKIGTLKEARAALSEEYQKLLGEVEALAEQFTLVNLDDQPASYHRAFEAFQAGQFNRTISILDSLNLEDKLNQAVAQQQQLEAQRKQELDHVILLAQTLRRLQRFEEAEQNYRLALKYDPKNTELHLALASLFEDWNRIQEAFAQIEQALKIISAPEGQAKLIEYRTALLSKN